MHNTRTILFYRKRFLSEGDKDIKVITNLVNNADVVELASTQSKLIMKVSSLKATNIQ